jgi:sugar phosphate isomerase/epimerase
LQADLAVAKEQIAVRDAWLRAAERFTKIEQQLAPLGLHAGLHNHTEEWTKTGSGETGWEIVFANTPASFVQEIDTCHCLEGGGNPLAMVRQYPGRTRLIHLKEFPRNHAPVNEAADDPFQAGKKLNRFGDGRVPWADLFAACESVGGTEWYVMELWMGANPIEGRDLENARQMIDFMRRYGRVQAA